MRLKRDEFLDIGLSLECGESIRINHESDDCSGESKSMVISKQENGDVRARCFRCGRSGFYLDEYPSALKSKTGREEIERSDGSARSIDDDYRNILRTSRQGRGAIAEGCRDIASWPRAARVWWRKYSLTDQEANENDIVFHPKLGSVLIPTYWNGRLCEIQERPFRRDWNGPKYLTTRYHDWVDIISSVDDVGNDSVCIVEDRLSAIKVGRHMDAIALHCTTISDEAVSFILRSKYKKAYIWLDDDNAIVKRNALNISKLLSPICDVEIVKTKGRDPKAHSDSEIKEILK